MALEWKMTVHGVRGSAPKSVMQSQRYGGNTSCISIECDNSTIILDAGSGISGFNKLQSKNKKEKRLIFLISHLHLDHIQGIMACSMIYDPEYTLEFYGPVGLQSALETLMSPPFWPISLEEVPSKKSFHELSGGAAFEIDGIHIDTMKGNHPGECLYYRIEGDGKRLVYALDLELDELYSEKMIEFAKNSDLLIWDSGFFPGDLKQGWGHSTWEQGQKLGRAAGVKEILMTHYGWQYEDEQLAEQERTAEKKDAICHFAKEGMIIKI